MIHLLENTSRELDVLRGVMLQKIKQRFPDVDDDEVYSVATFLDPRFKCIPFKTDRAVDEAKARVLRELRKATMKTRISSAANSASTSTATVAEPQQEQLQTPESVTQLSLWSFFNKKKDEMTSTAAITDDVLVQKIEQEVTVYLSEPILEHSAEGATVTKEKPTAEDVFAWWKANAVLYPHLTQLAHKYLMIPATSAASERSLLQ